MSFFKAKTPQANRKTHWSEQKEQVAGYWHARLLIIIYRAWPILFMRLGAFPVGLSYYLFSKKAREDSRRFLNHAAACLGTPERKFPIHPLRHILAFSLTVVEKVEVWGGNVSLNRICFQDDDCADLKDRLERGEGALLICSHLGNMELLRGLASFNRTGVSREIPVTSIADFSVTASFNRALQELNPKSMLRIISANDIGPDTVIILQERIAAGELVVIAGDRTSAHTRSKYFLMPFLNGEAPFAQGVFSLAALLNAPTYFVFALRRGDLSVRSQYDMYVHKNNISFDCSRGERSCRTEALARNFAEKLEYYCKLHPYQWYNFFDFWAKPDALPEDSPEPEPPGNFDGKARHEPSRNKR
jgi:predicted LPLAT superfamily acyltransferase